MPEITILIIVLVVLALVGWHAVPQPGPAPEYNLFFNVGSDANS